jgi:hypothetical protein
MVKKLSFFMGSCIVVLSFLYLVLWCSLLNIQQLGSVFSVPCPKRFAASPITNSLILTAFSILNMWKEMRSKWVTPAVLVETV